MAFKVQFFFLGICIIVGFLHTASSCNYDSDCTGSEGYSHCCGGECRLLSCSETTWCVFNSDCPGAKYCCSSSGACRYDLNNCPLSTLSIVGIVIGTVILVIIFTSVVVSCLCCASCPLYHARLRGRVIVARPPYQNLQTATVTTSTSTYQPPPQTIVPPPYPGPSAYPGNQPSGNPQFSNTNTQYTGVTQYPGPPPTNYS